jgi:predicted nucleic acid-binding protein
MTLYVDSSAFLKRYLREPDSDRNERLMLEDPEWVTARHTAVEIRRTLSRDLEGNALTEARGYFGRDWALTRVVELNEAVCEVAAQIAEAIRLRTLDALHLGAAQAAGSGQLPFLTYDARQAQAARALGWTVLGV